MLHCPVTGTRRRVRHGGLLLKTHADAPRSRAAMFPPLALRPDQLVHVTRFVSVAKKNWSVDIGACRSVALDATVKEKGRPLATVH